MPTAAPRPCTQPGCGVLVHGGPRCEAHKYIGKFGDKRRGSRHERGYGTEWDKRRERILARDRGLCQHCLRGGFVKPGRHVDHKINRAAGGTDDGGNLETLCADCHREKTLAEAIRGRGASKV